MGTKIETWQIINGELQYIDTTLQNEGRTEPFDLEPWIESKPEIVGKDIMIIGRQVPTNSGPIDLLGIDKSGNTVIIELKRNKLPRESLAQAIDYASNVAEWNIDRLREVCSGYRKKELEDVFDETFPGVDLGNVSLNSTQRIVLVGFVIETSLERMIEWLSDSYEVNINAIILSYAKMKGGDELLMKTSIISDEQERGRRTIRNLTEADFMDKCAPDLRPFFQKIIDISNKKEYSINWTRTSFSVRKFLPFSNRYASVIYCAPEGAFSFYFAQLAISEESAQALRKELLSTGIFKESGKKTLTSSLTSEMLVKAEEVAQIIFDRVDEIAKTF